MIYSVVQSSPHIPPCLSTRYPPLIHPISPCRTRTTKTFRLSFRETERTISLYNKPFQPSGCRAAHLSPQSLYLSLPPFGLPWRTATCTGFGVFCSRFIPRKRMQNRIIGRSSDLSSRPFPASFPRRQWVSVVRITPCANALCGTSRSGTYSSGSVTVSHRIPFSISVLRLIPTTLSMSNGFGICGAS